MISGESGAGKTEATKQCLGFIAEIAGSDSTLEQKILQTNPVLEAFGNAKTVRNDNSSRFGKWIEIHFDDENHICGASIESYLLEKSRVVFQQQNERNFHIFYQLFTSPAICEQYQLSTPSEYRYLTGGQCLSVRGIDDKQDFVEVLNSFTALNFSDRERDQVLNLVVAVLKIGNLQFVEVESKSMHPESKVANRAILEQVANQLGVPTKAFEEAVCTRRIVVREGSTENVTVIPLSVDVGEWWNDDDEWWNDDDDDDDIGGNTELWCACKGNLLQSIWLYRRKNQSDPQRPTQSFYWLPRYLRLWNLPA